MKFRPTHIFSNNTSARNIPVILINKSYPYYRGEDEVGYVWMILPHELKKINTTIKEKILKIF